MFESVVQMLDKVVAMIPAASPAVVATVGVVIELAVRLMKSDRPLSIAYGVAAIFRGIGNLFSKVGAFMDAVLPQRVNEQPKQ